MQGPILPGPQFPHQCPKGGSGGLSWHLRLALCILFPPAHHQEQLVVLPFLPSPPPVLPTKSQDEGDFHPGVVTPSGVHIWWDPKLLPQKFKRVLCLCPLLASGKTGIHPNKMSGGGLGYMVVMRAEAGGLGSEVNHRPQGGSRTLQGCHHDAELPVYLSPGCISGVCIHGSEVGIGQAWECGYRAGAGCPEHMANRRNRGGSGSFGGQERGAAAWNRLSSCICS